MLGIEFEFGRGFTFSLPVCGYLILLKERNKKQE
jgi:hypothetical protein